MAWSYVAGRRASSGRPSSRVRVYERDDVEGRIFLTCAWRTSRSGRPKERVLPAGTTREKAEALADLTAKKREWAILQGEVEVGAPDTVALGELLARYHDSATADDWSEGHRKEQERCRRFWTLALGEDLQVPTEISKARVRRAGRDAAEARDWSGRTEEKYLRYLHAAVRWGWRQADLYDNHPLRGLQTPDYEQDTSELIYTLDEIRRLATPHPEVDWRLTLAVNLAFDTGRRRRALTRIRAFEDTPEVELEGEGRLATIFRADHDKAGRTGLVVVSRQTEALARNAWKRRAVQHGGWLLPGGHLGHMGELVEQPLSPSGLKQLLLAAEDTLGINHVTGRGWHAIKRRHVTEGVELAEGDIDLVRSTTGNVDADVLEDRYRLPTDARTARRTARQVDSLREKLTEQEDDHV